MGTLMGKKIAFTELIAYGDLKVIMASGQISERTAIIASYALCGFANFGSIGIQLGGIGGMAPERKKDLAKLVTKAMVGGALASWLTATVAGILI
jgi:CNT family concentrative nucleoside transporter